MIILDTNVLSELIRRQPDVDVLAWVDAQPGAEVATTAVTAAELLYGVGRLPPGHRKTGLTEAVRGLIDGDLRGRIEPFDAAAAEHYATIVTDRERLGRPISVADAQIAAICRELHTALATRNIRDFQGTGVDLVDPWQTS